MLRPCVLRSCSRLLWVLVLLASCNVFVVEGQHHHDTGIGELGGVRIVPQQDKVEEPENGGMDMLKHTFMPLIGLGAGALMMFFTDTDSCVHQIGKLTLYFGAQTGMNLYMKAVLSSSPVSPEDGLKGLPAGFAVTGVQQLTSFILFVSWLGVSKAVGCPYEPKKLHGWLERIAVLLFSFSFTLNIALNNYSLSLIPISSNLIIRSCLPLATFVTQTIVAKVTREPIQDFRILEIVFMTSGVFFAGLACFAAHAGDQNKDSGSYVFGCIVCLCSLLSGALNLALAGMLGTSVKLNALDTTVYMSLPVVLFLIVPVFFYSHPVKDKAWINYIGDDQMTDWTIFGTVCNLSPATVWMAVLSGGLALAYNVLQYGIVQTLSAAHTTFAGNFNKAATIALSLLVGLESLPKGSWGPVMLIAVMCNIACFTAYNYVKFAAANKHDQIEDSGDDNEDSEDGWNSS